MPDLPVIHLTTDDIPGLLAARTRVVAMRDEGRATAAEIAAAVGLSCHRAHRLAAMSDAEAMEAAKTVDARQRAIWGAYGAGVDPDDLVAAFGISAEKLAKLLRMGERRGEVQVRGSTLTTAAIEKRAAANRVSTPAKPSVCSTKPAKGEVLGCRVVGYGTTPAEARRAVAYAVAGATVKRRLGDRGVIDSTGHRRAWRHTIPAAAGDEGRLAQWVTDWRAAGAVRILPGCDLQGTGKRQAALAAASSARAPEAFA